jgi:Mn-dependent DtxR family transcriptional regulator
MILSEEPEISPRKAEYLNYILEAGGVVKTTDLARNFSISSSTGSKAIRELAEAGFLIHAPYAEAILTEKGEKMAYFIQRRHRILTLLLSHYGFTRGEACAEVKNFENYVSRESVNRICASLGHPMMSVCGRIVHEEGCCLEVSE